MSSKFRLRPKLCASSFALGLSLGSVSVQAQALVDPPENMVDPSLTAVLQCEARKQFYDVDQDTLRRRYGAVFVRDHVPLELQDNYELDHIIPWCLCGSNDIQNMRAQPVLDVAYKERLERALCEKVQSNRMSMKEARARIYGWVKGNGE